jgi:DNA-binding transcriptional regulator/RsmH inhibitor MraZ
MEELRLRLDSKGRLYLPQYIREEIGDTVILRRTEEGFLIIRGQASGFLDEFFRVITSEPQRTGKPENWPPERMKAIWSPSQ